MQQLGRWMAGIVLAVAACGDVTPLAPDVGAALDARTDDAPDASDVSPDAELSAALVVDLDGSAGVVVNSTGNVSEWLDQSGEGNDAVVEATVPSSIQVVGVSFNGALRTALRFDARSALVAPPRVPPAGTLFIIFSSTGGVENRVLGWEDHMQGIHGFGLRTGDPMRPQRMDVLARASGVNGDIAGASAVTRFELDVVSWGPAGVTLERHQLGAAVERETRAAITTISDGGYPLRIGGSGSTPSIRFGGDILRLRIYRGQLTPAERDAVAASWL